MRNIFLFLFVGLTAALYTCVEKDKKTYTFPANFLWSTATSSYQIEGGAKEGGRGPSIWDTFSRIPQKIANNENGDIACDSYNKWEEDIKILKELGVKAYRFSISWSRIFPNGRRNWTNCDGVSYYHKLIDALKLANIEPLVTMYHWDLPQSLQDRGGWLNKDIVGWFKEYATFLFEEYGTKVKYWMTLNEPWTHANFGHCGTMSEHAPGDLDAQCKWAPYLAAHHMILAHAEAYHVYKDQFKNDQNGMISWANVAGWSYAGVPNDKAPETVLAHNYFWFWDPVLKGDYPSLMKENIAALSAKEGRTSSRLPEFTAEEKARIINTVDFLTVNYYITLNAKTVTYDITHKNWYHPDTYVVGSALPDSEAPPIPGGWIKIHPEGLFQVMNALRNRYGNLPMMITENGCMDAPNEGLDDKTRVLYLQQHITAVAKALDAGINVIGYNVWSLMDNFEWTGGYASKFGIYHVDFNSPDRVRTPKASALWYKKVIADNGLSSC